MKSHGHYPAAWTCNSWQIGKDFVGVSDDFEDRFFGAQQAIHEITRNNTNKKPEGYPSFDVGLLS